jgi:hypothetical protein
MGKFHPAAFSELSKILVNRDSEKAKVSQQLFATIGTSQDVTVEELRIESFPRWVAIRSGRLAPGPSVDGSLRDGSPRRHEAREGDSR